MPQYGLSSLQIGRSGFVRMILKTNSQEMVLCVALRSCGIRIALNKLFLTILVENVGLSITPLTCK